MHVSAVGARLLGLLSSRERGTCSVPVPSGLLHSPCFQASRDSAPALSVPSTLQLSSLGRRGSVLLKFLGWALIFLRDGAPLTGLPGI